MPNRISRILVVLPTYNERQTIGKVIRGLFLDSSTRYKVQVLVVDDNSPDGTAKSVQLMQKKYSDLHLISGNKNGLGEAYKNGFNFALKNIEFDALVMMDSDLSHDPADVKRMVKLLNSGFDVAIGSRYVDGGMIPGNWPVKRIINTRVAHFVARYIGGVKTDTKELTGGFKVIRRSAIEKIPFQTAKASGYGFQLFLSNQFIIQKLKVAEMPIQFHDRKAGISKLRSSDILEFILIAFRLNSTSLFKRQLSYFVAGLVNLSLLIFGFNSGNFAVSILLIVLFNLAYIYGCLRIGLFAKPKFHKQLSVMRQKSSGRTRISQRL